MKGKVRFSELQFFTPGWDWMDYPGYRIKKAYVQFGPAYVDSRFIELAVIDRYKAEDKL